MSEFSKTDLVQNLLREGVADYLKALHALHRFRREVSDIAVSVLKLRLPALLSAFGAPRLKPEVDLHFHLDSEVADVNDDAWILAHAWLAAPLNLNCSVGLQFERDDAGMIKRYVVGYMEATRATPARGTAAYWDLKPVFSDRTHSWTDDDWRTCGFRWDLQDPGALREEFEKVIDELIKAGTAWKAPVGERRARRTRARKR